MKHRIAACSSIVIIWLAFCCSRTVACKRDVVICSSRYGEILNSDPMAGNIVYVIEIGLFTVFSNLV